MGSPSVGSDTIFKTLSPYGAAVFGGTLHWSLPANGRPGDWMEVHGPLRTCENGLHLAIGPQVVEFLGPSLWIAEYEDADDTIDAAVKIVTRRARIVERVDGWNHEVARRWSVDIAELVLPIFEAYHPDESGPREALVLARQGDRDAAVWMATQARFNMQHVEMSPAASGALKAVCECPQWHTTRINEHARRTAKAAIRAFKEYGMDRQAAQRMLFAWLCRYLNGQIAPEIF